MAGPKRRCDRCGTLQHRDRLKKLAPGIWRCKVRAHCLKRLAKDLVGK